MKLRFLMPVAMLGFVATAPLPTPKADSTIRGDYVEARTASVFCGACHYNGELVTSGRDALLAWSISQGSWNGVDLSGVRAMAAISSDQNLGDPQAVRQCELVVDQSVSEAQMAAVTDWLRACDGGQLGQILPARRAAVSFKHDAEYVVSADGLGAISALPMANNECCTQPHLVWYSPLMPIQHRKVGYTESASYAGGAVGDQWDRSDENSAFYGSFAIAGK